MIVEVVRGKIAESTHHVDAVAYDCDGKQIDFWGDPNRIVFPRSSIKPLQTIPLVESGAFDRLHLKNRYLTLASSSHSGEKVHVDNVQEWLSQIGLSNNDLGCGAHYPFEENHQREMIRNAKAPRNLHNNCSGKHAGILSTICFFEEPTKGYTNIDHPAQIRIRKLLEEMMEISLKNSPWDLDGCSIPAFAMPLYSIAKAMAKMSYPKNLSEKRSAAIKMINNAIMESPYLLAGKDRFCTIMTENLKGNAIVKVGAEGFYTGILLNKGLGIALKVRDGNKRAAEVAMAWLLKKYKALNEELFEKLKTYTQPIIKNHRQFETGQIRVKED